MKKAQVNPWTWQDQLGFSQAWTVTGADKVTFLSGQAPIDPEGRLVGEDDFDTQAAQVFDNLAAVLHQAGASFDAVVKITVYLTDIARIRDFGRIKARCISGPQPASTAIGVTALALPGMMLEVEGIAVI